jgi:hypothetical protein
VRKVQIINDLESEASRLHKELDNVEGALAHLRGIPSSHKAREEKSRRRRVFRRRIEKKCLNCGETFHAKREPAFYCSQSCNGIYNRKKKALKLAKELAKSQPQTLLRGDALSKK